MGAEAKRCQALLPSGECKNGFPVTLPCDPGKVKTKSVPFCCNEEWCGRMYPKTGSPLTEFESRSAAKGEV